MSTVVSLMPKELFERRARGDDLQLVDVREPGEWQLCRIEGSVLVPLGDLFVRMIELDPARPVVCICHHGVRSLHAALQLEQLGFAKVFNLSGGIDRWAREVDASMARY